MVWRIARPVAVGAAASMLLAGLAAPAAGTAEPSRTGPGFERHHGAHGEVDVNVCSSEVPRGFAQCHARERLAPGDVAPADVIGNNGAYDPAYLESAYNADSTRGAGQTVAVVDAYDAPNAEADLATYRSHFGLPACTTANGCFSKIDQNGGTNYPPHNPAWEQEISLDIQMVSAMCPQCDILLVEASSNSLDDLGTAVNKAVELGANVVSNSYGGSEWSGESLADSAYYHHPGVALVASTGDNGYEVNYPAASPAVVAVGGTTLHQATNTGTRNATETVWSGAGSGCSAYLSKPAWQSDPDCANRTVGDVAAVADPATGVWVYNGGWLVFGGTSAAAPIVGAMYALAENPASSDEMASYPYAHTSSLNDVDSGSNGSCGTYLCNGAPGYDGPTGLGTPNGWHAFVPGSVGFDPDYSVDAVPVLTPLRVGDVVQRTVTVTPTDGFVGNVQLSASVNPSLGLGKKFSPTNVNVDAPATSTLTYVAYKPGSYTVTITATDGVTTRTKVRRVYVNDFSLALSPAKVAAVRGATIRFTLTVTPAGSFNLPVKLSATGVRRVDRLTYAHNPALYKGSQTITLKTSKLGGTGTFTIMIKGTAGPLNHFAVAKLVLR